MTPIPMPRNSKMPDPPEYQPEDDDPVEAAMWNAAQTYVEQFPSEPTEPNP